ncbi:hypothetical protein Xsto_04120 [Xenorhabdus stockiae]|uniref:Uncharacterized protein n=1 Tax=Xenorhabdus stockiae TaxID=351614 RepID=A0A2D0K4S9_9GAMM|nr:hypothetical protein [Xenorhabdus stockiae]PHM57043.1 hypothetical protein Xsto_04120 [Xenorhabdus stockiae]
MIKEIYGVKIFPLVVMFYQVRRWWVLRKLQNWWRADMRFLKVMRQRKWVWDHFNFYKRYRFLRLLAECEQQRGNI